MVGQDAASLLQTRVLVARDGASVPTPFGRRSIARGPELSHSDLSSREQSTLPACGPRMPDIARIVVELSRGWERFVRRDFADLACLSSCQKRACAFRPPGGHLVGAHVYVDGAFFKGRDRHRGGWAAVIVGEWSDGSGTWFAAEGFACGPLIDFTRRPIQAEYSSYDAEAAAVLVVLAWQLAVPFPVPVTVHFDAQAVGFAVEGVVAPRCSGDGLGLAGRARRVAQLLEARGQAPSYVWVTGHAGILWNELADRIAKASALEAMPSSHLPPAFWNFVESQALPWAWLTADKSGAFPDLETLRRGTYEAPDPVPASCAPASLSTKEEACRGEMSLSLVSLNVQTLQDKRPVILQQLSDKRALLCGLQETRCRQDMQCNSGGFVEFASAACAGEGGCTLLVSTVLPYARVDGRPLFLAKSHCRCLHATPQLLAVEIRAPFFQRVCVVGHLPHTGRPLVEVMEWWGQLAAQKWFRGAGAVIMLLDANAQVGSVSSEAVGSHAQEVENATGTLFREFMETHGLCAPATYFGVCGECVPQASEATWTSPRGFCRRIDYIVVPQAWRTACACPRVDSTFVTLSVDHRPVCLDVRAALVDSLPKRTGPALPRQSHFLQDAGLQTMRLALWAMPPVAWAANVHARTAYVYEAAKLGAREAGFYKTNRRTRKFLSPAAADLLQAAKDCKHRLRQLDRLQRKIRLRALFWAWKGETRVAASREGWTVSDIHKRIACCLADQEVVSKQLRWRMRYDKGAHAGRALEEMQRAARPCAAKAFYRALRCLRPAGKRVLKPFGRLQITPFAEDEDSLAVRQQRHFANIEAGDVIDAASYLQHDSQAARGRPGSSFDPALLPTLIQLEGLFRGAKQGKAPGPNGIPEWLWALDSRAAARAFLPVFLKAHFRLTEPVQFKSTALIALFKGKGSPAVLANHRAIALLDGPGKALRRSMRPALVSLLPPPDQQQGGTPGSLLAGAHHLVRAHQQLALG